MGCFSHYVKKESETAVQACHSQLMNAVVMVWYGMV